MNEERKDRIGCYICGIAENIPFKCNYCKEYFCSTHRNPINHSCQFVNVYKKKRQDMLHNNQNYTPTYHYREYYQVLYVLKLQRQNYCI